MPEVLDALPKRAMPEGFGGGGRSEKFPYDEWFTGQPLLLVAGTDFESSPQSMQTNIRTAAKRRGIKVKTILHERGVALQSLGTANGNGASAEAAAEAAPADAWAA